MEKTISLELLLRDEVRRLLDNFASLMKIQTVFFSADGRILSRGVGSGGRGCGNSEYCRLMQNGHFGLTACAALDRRMQNECRNTGKMLRYECHAGLSEVIAPVIVGGSTAGFIMFGQFRTAASPPPFAASDPEKAAFAELPLIPPEDLRNLTDVLKMLIDYIVARELVVFSDDLRMLKLNRFIERNVSGKLSLRVAARHLACSESALTHYLRRCRNTSFTQLVNSRRLELAEQLMREQPELTLAELAERCGFSDHHYFARVYRARRGMTPGEFRAGRRSAVHSEN